MGIIWEQMAHLVEVNYGCQVDWEERFFICPDCGEPIYECDWADSDLVSTTDTFICPICDGIID